MKARIEDETFTTDIKVDVLILLTSLFNQTL